MRTVRRGFATTAGRGAAGGWSDDDDDGENDDDDEEHDGDENDPKASSNRSNARPELKRAVGVCELCTANCRRFRFNRRGDEKSTFDRARFDFSRARVTARCATRVTGRTRVVDLGESEIESNTAVRAYVRSYRRRMRGGKRAHARPSSSTPDDSLYVRVPTSRLRRKEHDIHRSLQSPSGQTAKLLVAVRTRPAEVAPEGHARGERAEKRNATSSSTPNARARYSTSSTATSVRSSLNVRRMKSILRVVNRDTVVVMDPDEEKAYLDQVQRRSKARRYTFDVAFNELATNADVYEATGRGLISGVVNGMNSTVFAYGAATGSGKTHTMIGNYKRAPG